MNSTPEKSNGSESATALGSEIGGELVRLDNVSVRYQVRSGLFSSRTVDIDAVDGVTLAVRSGHTVGLVGATGSGKSTIAHLVMGMVAPSQGSVTVAGRKLDAKGGSPLELQAVRQVVLQDPFSSLNPRMRVGDIIAEPLTVGRRSRRSMTRSQLAKRVGELLELVGLPPDRADRFPHQFSGGQRQRIAIARALAPEPKLIVLDEPTSALDVSVRAQILNLLRRLQTQLAVTYLIVSHDLLTVGYLASTVAVMHRGRIVEIGPTTSLFTSPRHPATLELLASAPGFGGAFLHEPRPSVGMPLPASACHFAARCTLRAKLGEPEQCVTEDPPLDSKGVDHFAACHFSDEIESLSREIGKFGI